MFLRNCWLVAARDVEFSRTSFSRILPSEPVVMYRQADGASVAPEDRCCHRYMPLLHGKLEGDNLRRGYHGLPFDAEGVCIEVPGQPCIPVGGFEGNVDRGQIFEREPPCHTVNHAICVDAGRARRGSTSRLTRRRWPRARCWPT